MTPDRLYLSIGQIEITLRRALRFELMGTYGRKWLVSLGDNFDLIQERLRNEALSSRRPISELSYLSLGELVHILFDQLWTAHFAKIFNQRRSFKSSLLRDLTPLRNKVAHFREISKQDVFNLASAAECIGLMSDYYSHPSRTSAYLPADPYWISDSIDSDGEQTLVKQLEELNLANLWDEYSAFESIKTVGLRTGVGLYAKHFFLELYSADTSAFTPALAHWYANHNDTVTFVRCGKKIIRVFWTTSLTAVDLKKDIRSLLRTLLDKNLSNDGKPTFLPIFSDGLGVNMNNEKFIGVAF